MTKKSRLKTIKKLATWMRSHIHSELNLLGVDAALLLNFGLSLPRRTVAEIYNEYKRQNTGA